MQTQLLAKIEQLTKQTNDRIESTRKEAEQIAKSVNAMKRQIVEITADTDRLREAIATKTAQIEALKKAPTPPRGVLRAVPGGKAP